MKLMQLKRQHLKRNLTYNGGMLIAECTKSCLHRPIGGKLLKGDLDEPYNGCLSDMSFKLLMNSINIVALRLHKQWYDVKC